MKNALVYSINNNQRYIDGMINSINSFYANNPQSLLDTMEVVIVTEDDEIPMAGIDPKVKYRFVRDMSCNYHDINIICLETYKHIVFIRYEMFTNRKFFDYDSVLYLDSDTEVVAPLPELFDTWDEPVVGMIEEPTNNMESMGIHIPHYCNSGVILTHPKAIGPSMGRSLFRALIDAANEHPGNFPDQDALNFVFTQARWRNRRKIYGSEYNYFCQTLWKRPPVGAIKIIHHARGIDTYEKFYIRGRKHGETKNAVAYLIESVESVEQMVESINSLGRNTPQHVLDTIRVFVVSAIGEIDISSEIEWDARITVIAEGEIDCDENMNFHLTSQVFNNSAFHEFDNVLLLNPGLQIVGNPQKIFSRKEKPIVGMWIHGLECPGSQKSELVQRGEPSTVLFNPKMISPENMELLGKEIARRLKEPDGENPFVDALSSDVWNYLFEPLNPKYPFNNTFLDSSKAKASKCIKVERKKAKVKKSPNRNGVKPWSWNNIKMQ